MRVVCESCQAKYQVSDERVAGKKLKIRCRRCGGTIVIRGDLEVGAADAPQAVIAPAAGVEEWFASIDGQEHGPLTRAQLVEWLGEHPAAWDAYLWREGFTDWTVARDVDAITAELTPPPASTPPAPPEQGFDGEPTTVAVDVAYMAAAEAASFEEDDSPTRNVSAAMVSGTAREPVPAPSGHAEASLPPGVFTAAVAAYAGSESDAVEMGPRVELDEVMTGARNENSVLFSASNLAQVAQSSTYSAASVGVTARVVPSSRAGYASGDASGLIDIRALANLASASTATPAVPGPVEHEVGRDELLLQQPPAFTPDTLAPVAMPKAERSNNALPIAIITGATIVAAAVVTVAFLRPGAEPSPAPAVAAGAVATPSAVADSVAEPVRRAAEDENEGPAAVAEPTDVDESAGEGQPEPSAKPAARPAVGRGDGLGRMGAGERPRKLAARKAAGMERGRPGAGEPSGARKSAGDGPRAVAAAAAKADDGEADDLDDLLAPRKQAQPAPDKADDEGPSVDDLLAGPADKPKAKAQSSKSHSVDELLDMAVSGKKPEPKPEAKPEPKADLPDTPGRADVLKAMKGVEGKVQKCASDDGQTGVATVQITVASSGRVSDAQVSGITGDAGSCIARAVRGADFPAFAKPSFSIKFPFRIK